MAGVFGTVNAAQNSDKRLGPATMMDVCFEIISILSFTFVFQYSICN
jgi:hypothetical protein